MINEYLVEIVSICEAIVIVIAAKAEVVELRQVIMQTGDDIEARKIKFCELVVEEELLYDSDLRIQRVGDPRLIHQSNPWSDQDIILLASADERGVGCPVKRRVNRNREWFILFHPL